MVITRWSSTDSATAATAHVFPLRTRVSPSWGTRSVIAYSQAPLGKRMVIDSEAIGLLSPLYLTRCQVGTAGGRAVGSDPRVADFVLFETLCSCVDAVNARPRLLEGNEPECAFLALTGGVSEHLRAPSRTRHSR